MRRSEALDAATGSPRWRINCDTVGAAPRSTERELPGVDGIHPRAHAFALPDGRSSGTLKVPDEPVDESLQPHVIVIARERLTHGAGRGRAANLAAVQGEVEEIVRAEHVVQEHEVVADVDPQIGKQKIADRRFGLRDHREPFIRESPDPIGRDVSLMR